MIDLSNYSEYSPKKKAQAANSIAEIIKVNHTLRKISIGDCHFTEGQTYEIIESAKRSCTLAYIGLSWNHVGDKGATAIAELLQVSCVLKEIDICNCKITTNGLK